jgi:hypothetical protein
LTASPEALAPAGANVRVSADVAPDLARRLRTWAGMRGQSVSALIGELLTREVPTGTDLAAQMQQIGAGNGHAEH